MSGITGLSGYNAGLFSYLSQADDGLGDAAPVDSVIAASATQAATQDADATSTATGTTSELQNQIQAAVTAALQSAEQSGNSDLKGAIYSTLVAVLKNHGIDPKTFKPTGGTAASDGSGQEPMDAATKEVLAQVLAAVSGASAARNPLAQVTSGIGDQGATDLFSLLSASEEKSQSSEDTLFQFLSSQDNNQDLLGFMFDSEQ